MIRKCFLLQFNLNMCYYNILIFIIKNKNVPTLQKHIYRILLMYLILKFDKVITLNILIEMNRYFVYLCTHLNMF